MSVATYEGYIEDGRIRFSANVHIPEMTKVYVIVPDGEVVLPPPAILRSPRLVRPEQAEDFKKVVVLGIHDAGV